MSEEWRSRAKCQGKDPDLFFPPEPAHTAQAICADCSVRGECFTYARDNHIRYGVWGGQDMTGPSRVGRNQPVVQTCAGDCGRTVASPAAMQPGYVRLHAYGMCTGCASREYGRRRGVTPLAVNRAKREEVLRQHRRGITADAIAVNVGYSKVYVQRIIKRQKEATP